MDEKFEETKTTSRGRLLKRQRTNRSLSAPWLKK